MRKLKPYTSSSFLYDEYVKKGKTAKEIAEEVGCTEMTVYNYLKKFDLLRYKGRGRTLGRRRIGGGF